MTTTDIARHDARGKWVGTKTYRPACSCGWTTVRNVSTALRAERLADRLHCAAERA